MTDSLDELIQKHLDGRTSPEEAESLSARIVADKDVRSRYLKAAQIHGALADETLALDLESEPIVAAPELQKVIWHFAWPRQIAAGLVAGLFVGILGVGMVWAVGSPKAEARALRIAHGDFESLPAGPIAKGFPVRFGEWGGNPAEVIKEDDGNNLLKFVRTANVKEDPNGFASNCSVFQLVDLSALRQQWIQSQSQFSLKLSARFRRDPAPNDADLPKPKASVRIFLFQAEPESIREAWPRVVQQAEALGKKSIKLEPGDDAATISTSCILESDATVALIAVAASAGINSKTSITLGGYFVDDVQLTVIKQPKLPVQVVSR